MDTSKVEVQTILEMDIATMESGIEALKRQVMQLQGDGYSNKQIMSNRADILEIVRRRWNLE